MRFNCSIVMIYIWYQLRYWLKNTTSLISRILFLNYHLSSFNITAEIMLPTLELERVALKRSYTWHYSTQGLPDLLITY
jgi:hypothetical protein